MKTIFRIPVIGATNQERRRSVSSNDIQPELGLDDGSGLRVVSAKAVEEQKFSWDLFARYDKLRVLTYSASIGAIVRMLDDYRFSKFECVFGCEGILKDIKMILAFQKLVAEDTSMAIMKLPDKQNTHVL